MARAAMVKDEEAHAASDTEKAKLFRLLRDRITTGTLAPGTALRELELADELKTSRNRLREVLALLEQRGLVEREHNRHTIVRRFSLDEMREIFQTREALEGMCARLAAINTEAHDWQDLVELFSEPTEQLVRNGEFDGYVRNTNLLRQRILEAANNKTLVRALYPLLDQASLAMRRVVLATNRTQDALHQHRAVLSALQSGDPDLADQAKRRQIAGAWQALERYHQYIL
jgi:DNA-binding GntR family transcriptional regulator